MKKCWDMSFGCISGGIRDDGLPKVTGADMMIDTLRVSLTLRGPCT